jgi:hypothetical protein
VSNPNPMPIPPLSECSPCGKTFFTEELNVDAYGTKRCEECLTDEAVAYAEFKAEENWGR